VKRIFVLLHWLNIDIAIGAVITSLFISNNLEIDIPHIPLIALCLSVLSIYNFDHLMDANRIVETAQSGRHRFYQANFKYLAIYQLVLLLLLLIAGWFVPANVLQAGSILALISLIYFFLLFIILPNRFALKEVIIGAVYACGIFLIPWVSSSFTFSWVILVMWGQIFLLALLNILIFSWYDYELDTKEKHSSLAILLGKRKIHYLNFALLGFLGLSIITLLNRGIEMHMQLIILGMGALLLLCMVFSDKLKNNDLFRVVGDAIFLIPLIDLLGQW